LLYACPYPCRPNLRLAAVSWTWPQENSFKDGQKIALPPKALKCSRPCFEPGSGEVVTREELRGRLGLRVPSLSSDDQLNHAVKNLRSVRRLAEFIETLPRYGYRLIASTAARQTGAEDPVPSRATFAQSFSDPSRE